MDACASRWYEFGNSSGAHSYDVSLVLAAPNGGLVMITQDISNEAIAEAFEEVATLLEAQDANPFRIRAWQNGAQAIRHLRRPLTELAEEVGPAGLTRLRGIGKSLANAIVQFVSTGHLPLLERLRGDLAAEKLFAHVPGIGPKTAAVIHEQLDIETLGELQAATFDGRLGTVPGMGAKRVQAVRDFLSNRFRAPVLPQQTRAWTASASDGFVPVAEILDIDTEYRQKADSDQLTRIAPAVSIPLTRPGCPFCIPLETIGTTRRCTRTRPELMNLV